ncbi:MAG TPA: hypothetical protein VEK84_03325, partial [Terriglobales bacterium]|nr:hypothetical protein [Terriglobales bacterium]
ITPRSGFPGSPFAVAQPLSHLASFVCFRVLQQSWFLGGTKCNALALPLHLLGVLIFSQSNKARVPKMVDLRFILHLS